MCLLERNDFIKKAQITISDYLRYGGATLAGNFIGCISEYWIAFPIIQAVVNAFPNIPTGLYNFVGILFLYPITLLFPWAVLFFALKRSVPGHYLPGEKWSKSAMKLILPIEIVRFLVCLPSCGFINTTRWLAVIPTDLFDLLYLSWSGRYEDVRQLGQFIFQDYVAYTLGYLVYLAVYLSIVLMIYNYYWKTRGKKDYENMVI